MPDPNFVRIGDVAFLVPAKNASTSVLTALCWQTGREDPGPAGIHQAALFPYLSHRDAARSLYPLVGVVRDPLARLLSCWRNKCFGTLPPGMHRQGFYSGMAWSAFVDLAYATPDGNANLHFRSQAYDLIECIGRPLARVLRVEDLDAGWAELEQWLGWPAKGVPVLNESAHLPAPPVTVTERQRRQVAHRYAADYGAFGYERRAA